MAVLGLRFCARAFSSCGKRGPLFIAARGPLTIAASLVVEHRLQTRRLSSCGSRAQLLRGMWDLPRPGHEPVSPALAGRFSTTAPPGKPRLLTSINHRAKLITKVVYISPVIHSSYSEPPPLSSSHTPSQHFPCPKSPRPGTRQLGTAPVPQDPPELLLKLTNPKLFTLPCLAFPTENQ